MPRLIFLISRPKYMLWVDFGTVEYAQMLLIKVAGQLGPKSSRPLSQLGPGSTRPESTRPGVFSERSGTYIYCIWCVLYMYTLSEL